MINIEIQRFTNETPLFDDGTEALFSVEITGDINLWIGNLSLAKVGSTDGTDIEVEFLNIYSIKDNCDYGKEHPLFYKGWALAGIEEYHNSVISISEELMFRIIDKLIEEGHIKPIGDNKEEAK